MPHLLLIDATLGAVALILATWIVLRSGRRARPSKGHGEVAEPASEETALGEMTVVPGLSEGAVDPGPRAREPDPGVYEPDPDMDATDPDLDATDPDMVTLDPGVREPAGLKQAPPQVSRVADADSGADGPEPVAHEPARPQQAPAQLNGAASAGPGTHAPVPEPGGQPGADGTVASNGRVYNYYDGADQPMADYLAELGWSEESGAREPW